jgi:hypothetical protein
MLFLRKIEQKKQGQNTLCWFFSKQFKKWNVQVTFENHTSYFFNMKYIQVLQHLNHIECSIKSHRPTKSYVPIRTLIVHHQKTCFH